MPLELPAALSIADTALPRTVHLLGNLLTFRARGADTQGSFSLLDCRSAPGQGAPPHRHQEAEAFLVLDGTFEIAVEGDFRICNRADFAYVAPGQAHSFRNVGEAPARLLIMTMPAGLHEGFFDDAGDAVEPGATEFPPMMPPDLDRLYAAATRAHMELLPAHRDD